MTPPLTTPRAAVEAMARAWPGPGPEPSCWSDWDGTIVYRSYSDYADGEGPGDCRADSRTATPLTRLTKGFLVLLAKVEDAGMDPDALTERLISALCALHPGIQAVLDGEAVVVPRVATWGMVNQGAIAALEHRLEGKHSSQFYGAGGEVFACYGAMLASSPYAPPAPGEEEKA